MESGLKMLSRLRCANEKVAPSAAAATSEETAEPQKVTVVELQPDDGLAASKMHIYSLIKSALQEQVKFTRSDFARVLVFDGRCLFNHHEFINCFVAERHLLEQVRVWRPHDDNIMVSLLKHMLKLHLTCNLNCRLVVIIAHSPELFPQFLLKINTLLFGLSLPVPVILVVDRLNRAQFEFYKQKSACEVLQCKLEKQQQENDDPRKVSISILSNKNPEVVSKLIEMRPR